MNNHITIIPKNKELYDYHNSYIDNSFLARILANRNILSKLPKKYDKLKDPSYFFKDIEEVASYLDKAIKERPESIIIHNDFDNDGFSGALILKLFIQEKYGVLIDVYTNSRDDGYEMTPGVVDKLYNKGQKSLIITIDKGISSYEGIEYAKSLGMNVIVTDHHHPKKNKQGNSIKSKADYIVCHTLEDLQGRHGNNYSPCDLCGASTVWYLCRAIDDRIAAKYVDIAGVATVVDLVKLSNFENRKIVTKSLANIRSNLFSNNSYKLFVKTVLNKELKSVNVTDFGYNIGPIINASCRYDYSAILLNKMIEGLGYEDIETIVNFNERRKSEVERYLDILRDSALVYDNFIIFKDKNISSNLAGLIASKFSSEYNKAVFVFKEDEESGKLKGSSRSSTYDLQELFTDKYSVKINGGGHTAAAGLDLAIKDFDVFVEELIKNVDYKPSYTVDIFLKEDIRSIDLKTVEDFEALEPYGMDFKSPSFLIAIDSVKDIRKLKDKHLTFNLTNYNTNIKVISFYTNFDYVDIEDIHNYYMIGSFSINEFRGQKSVQFIISNILKKSESIVTL